MGFKYSYNAINAVKEINAAAADSCCTSNDGFIAWGAKQDLYRIKWILEDALQRCPEFGSIEQEWLRDQDKKRLIGLLKK